MSGACSLKSLLLEGFTDRVHNEGLQNAFEDLLITLYSHKMATGLATSVDKSSCRESRKCKQKNKKKQSQGHNREVIKKLCICRCNAIKNYVANLRGGLNEKLEKEGVLLRTTSLTSATSHELTVLCHQIEEDIINGNVDTNKIKLSHRPNGEGGKRQPWIVPHQQLNAKLQRL
jgi:hypothetical protein